MHRIGTMTTLALAALLAGVVFILSVVLWQASPARMYVTAVGENHNIALGANAGDNLTTGDNNIDIGNEGVTDEGSTIRIGAVGTQNATFVAGVGGAAVTGTAVVVNGSGQLGVGALVGTF